MEHAELQSIEQELPQLNVKDLSDIKDLVELQAQMSDELISRFARNIEAFKRYMPQIGEFYEHYQPKRTMEFFCAPGGAPNLLWVDENKVFYRTLDPKELCRRQVELLLRSQRFYQVRYDNEYDPFGQIHHRYMNEAVNVLKDYKVKDGTPLLSGSVPCCMMFGCGLGYVLEHLYSRIEIANLILIEPDTDVFFASLHTFDWAPLLDFLHEQNCALCLLLGADTKTVMDDLTLFYNKHGKFISGYLWNFIHYHSPEIDAIAQLVIKDYSRNYSALGFFDDHMFGVSHGVHLLTEQKANLARSDVQLPEKVREDIPVFVVGNGPSLTQDLPFLRRCQDKALILACGTAVETLYNAGIQADFYAATERVPMLRNTLLYLPDQHYLDDVMLLSSDVIHPSTVSVFKHSFIFSKADEPFFWLLLQHHAAAAKRWRPIVLMNPLVGNLGLSSALNLGFKKLYLFGLDNGRKLGTQAYHPELSGIYQEIFRQWLTRVEQYTAKLKALDPSVPDMPKLEDAPTDPSGRRLTEEERTERYERYIENLLNFYKACNVHIRRLKENGHPELNLYSERKPIPPTEVKPGNFGGEVHCNGMYKLSKLYMELIIEFYKNEQVINCSDGVKLDHTTPMHSEELAETFANLPNVDKAAVKRYLEEEMTFRIPLTHKEFKSYCDPEIFSHYIDKLMATFDERPKTRMEYMQRLESHAEAVNEIGWHISPFLTLMIDGSMNTFFILILSALFKSADEEQGMTIANKIVDIYLNFLSDAKKLFPYLPDYCIGEHQKYTNFKVGFDHPGSPAPDCPHIREVITDEVLARKKKGEPFIKRYV